MAWPPRHRPGAGRGHHRHWQLLETATFSDYTRQELMGFHLSDQGFKIRLSTKVAKTLPPLVLQLVPEFLAQAGLSPAEVKFWGIHPGGAKIIDYVGEALGLATADLHYSREVLRQYATCPPPPSFLSWLKSPATANPPPAITPCCSPLAPASPSSCVWPGGNNHERPPMDNQAEIIALQQQLAQKNAQLAAIRDISRAIAAAQDLNNTLDLITRRAAEVMNVDSCSIYLYNHHQDQLVLAASTGLNQEGIGHYTIPFGEGLTGWAAKNRETVALADAFIDPRFYRILGSGESKFPSLMSMPLVSRDKVIGAANVQTKTRHEFTAEEIELFGFITELAATALEKAQLVHAALVQEMHHRVKNNLQTIAMLLQLQLGRIKKSPPMKFWGSRLTGC
jgi:putative methionine-R-sulfoxide reductase with GAF domain